MGPYAFVFVEDGTWWGKDTVREMITSSLVVHGGFIREANSGEISVFQDKWGFYLSGVSEWDYGPVTKVYGSVYVWSALHGPHNQPYN